MFTRIKSNVYSYLEQNSNGIWFDTGYWHVRLKLCKWRPWRKQHHEDRKVSLLIFDFTQQR